MGRPEEADHGVDPTGLVGAAALPFEAVVFVAGAEQADKVSAGREANGADALGVDVIFARVGPQTAHGRLAVLNLSRQPSLRRQPIAHVHAQVAARRPRFAGLFHAFAIARSPAASFAAHDTRTW